MDQLDVFWKNIAEDLAQQFRRGNPSSWSRSISEEFVSDLEATLLNKVKNDSYLGNILRAKRTKENRLYIGSISAATVENIFKYRRSKGNKHTKNCFAIYLGYNSAKDYIDRKIYGIQPEITQDLSQETHKELLTETTPRTIIKTELEKWKKQVLEDPKWNPVQLILNHHLHSETIYQPIYLSTLNRQEKLMTNEEGEMREFQLAQNIYQKSLAAISIHSLLGNLSQWSILIGVPGSGKTSSMKWLLQQVTSESVNDYDYVIYISLSDLDDYLQTFPKSTLYSCFFHVYLRHEIEKAEDLGKLFEQQFEHLGDILFLFDGLDEVNPERRLVVVNHIHKSLHHHNVIITSRPSAASVLFSLRTPVYYDIIPLPPPSIRNLVTQYSALVSNSLPANEILRKISDSIALQKLAITPFILIVICEIISHPNFSKDIQLNQAMLFSNLVKLIRQDHNERNKHPLEEKHIEVLKEFAERLCFSSGVKAIKGSLPDGIYKKEALVHSRFLNEVGLNLGTFEFIHLRLQEYFTALSICKKDVKAIEAFIAEKALDPEWLEITCFLVSHSTNNRLNTVIDTALKKHLEWIKHELTGNGWYRLAKIQVAKGKSLREESLGINLYEVLFSHILQYHPLYPKFIELLIESDGIYFLKDIIDCLKSTQNPSTAFIYTLYNLTPIPLQETSGLIELTKNTPHWLLNFNLGFGFLDEKDLIVHRSVLMNAENEPHDTIANAIKLLSSAGDYQSVNLLAPFVSHSNPFTKEASQALARIGGADAACVLAKALTNRKFSSHEELEAISWSLILKHRGILEPKSKGILFDWLLTLKAPYPENTEYVIRSLQGVKLNTPITKKLIEILLSTSSNGRSLRTIILERISEMQDEKDIEHLLRYALIEKHTQNLDIAQSIAFVPLSCSDLIAPFYQYLKTGEDYEKKAYLKVFLRSWNKFPNHSAFSFVPNLFKDEFSLSEKKNDDNYYRSNLWEIITTYDMSSYFTRLAWADLMSEITNVNLKKYALNYLEYSNCSLDNQQIQKLKEQLIKDQKQSSLKDYVEYALSYLVSKSNYQTEKVISYVKAHFDSENQEYFVSSIVKEATLSGHLIIGNKD